MIRTVLSMVVRPGCGPRFEEVWVAAAAGISRKPGNLGQTLARDAAEDRRYVITSDWATAAALRDFESSEERQALSEALGELRESAEKSVLTVVTTVPAAATARAAS